MNIWTPPCFGRVNHVWHSPEDYAGRIAIESLLGAETPKPDTVQYCGACYRTRVVRRRAGRFAPVRFPLWYFNPHTRRLVKATDGPNGALPE